METGYAAVLMNNRGLAIAPNLSGWSVLFIPLLTCRRQVVCFSPLNKSQRWLYPTQAKRRLEWATQPEFRHPVAEALPIFFGPRTLVRTWGTRTDLFGPTGPVNTQTLVYLVLTLIYAYSIVHFVGIKSIAEIILLMMFFGLGCCCSQRN